MSLINKMNVGNTNYDIQDRLMPDAIGQAGQVLKVKDDASGLEFGTIESGGGKLYQHFIIASTTQGTYCKAYITLLSNSYDSINTVEKLKAIPGVAGSSNPSSRIINMIYEASTGDYPEQKFYPAYGLFDNSHSGITQLDVKFSTTYGGSATRSGYYIQSDSTITDTVTEL